jgi:hypothetical protein
MVAATAGLKAETNGQAGTKREWSVTNFLQVVSVPLRGAALQVLPSSPFLNTKTRMLPHEPQVFREIGIREKA